jgi:hypothetical protein
VKNEKNKDDEIKWKKKKKRRAEYANVLSCSAVPPT